MLYVAWQDPSENSRRWFPIGRLQFRAGEYEFAYTQGALEATEKAGFIKIQQFDDLRKTYRQADLFPVFSNRVLSHSRPDFKEFAQWLNLPADEQDPLVILARGGAVRKMDTLQIFPEPENVDGKYVTHFFVHGIRHLPGALEAVEHLSPGTPLRVVHDAENAFDNLALKLLNDDVCIGYCPRYLNKDLHKLLASAPDKLSVQVERVNPQSTPIQFRLLCRLEAAWPNGFTPFSDPEYQPIQQALAS
jgi:HIRAN domain